MKGQDQKINRNKEWDKIIFSSNLIELHECQLRYILIISIHPLVRMNSQTSFPKQHTVTQL